MTDFQTIHYSVSANGQIGTLTIDRPEALNALSTQVLSELEIVIDQIAQERTVRVLVITGAGRSFVAGADIAEMAELTPQEALAFGERGARVFRKVELLYCPVIARSRSRHPPRLQWHTASTPSHRGRRRQGAHLHRTCHQGRRGTRSRTGQPCRRA